MSQNFKPIRGSTRKTAMSQQLPSSLTKLGRCTTSTDCSATVFNVPPVEQSPHISNGCTRLSTAFSFTLLSTPPHSFKSFLKNTTPLDLSLHSSAETTKMPRHENFARPFQNERSLPHTAVNARSLPTSCKVTKHLCGLRVPLPLW